MKYIIGLSPMDGVTDAAFRLTQCQIAKPDLIFTEFVSAEGLAHSAIKLLDTLKYSPVERPIIAQLFGKDPDSFYIATLVLCTLGFDGIDLNFGCPAKTVTQHGSGAALIAKPEQVKQIIESTKKAMADFQKDPEILFKQKLKKKFLSVVTDYCLPFTDYHPTLSFKTRLGISESEIDTWIPFLCSFKPDFITLHGRTLKQGYSGVASWDEIKKATEICHQNNIKIFGNGDLQSRHQAFEYCQQYNTDGALIGRAAMGNPWLFDDKSVDFKVKYQAMLLHAQNFLKLFPSRRFDPLRRHFLLYVSGHPQATKLRSEIVKLTSIDQLCALEDKIVNC